MNVAEKQGLRFVDRVYDGNEMATVENMHYKIGGQLNSYFRNIDKLSFLNVFRVGILEKKIEHESVCNNKVNCSTSEEFDITLFVVDQFIYQIQENYTPEVENSDKFTPVEQSEMFNKINDVLDRLEKLNMGQEIIFNEIDELKQHLNLGKKKWTQLVVGKAVELTVTKVAEKALIDETVETLLQGISNAKYFLGN